VNQIQAQKAWGCQKTETTGNATDKSIRAMVRAQPESATLSGTTSARSRRLQRLDASGHAFAFDSGTYELRRIGPNLYWQNMVSWTVQITVPFFRVAWGRLLPLRDCKERT